MLTPRQQQLLEFLETRAASSTVGPSVAEMAKALSLSSPSSVHHLLVSLEKRGYIKRFAHRARAIVLMPHPNQPATRPSDRFSATAPIVGKIDLTIKVAALKRNGPALSLPPEIRPRGACFALKIASTHVHHDNVRHGDVCVFDRDATPKPGDIVLIRPQGVDYALLCSYIITRGARVFEPIDPRSTHHTLPATEIQALGSGVAVLRAL